MKTINYKDIKNGQFNNLNTTLSNCLLDGRLCIAELNLECSKLKIAIENRNSLKGAKYVIFSKDMVKYHRDEMFLFINESGEIVDKVYGNEFWLYDMIEICAINKETQILH